jgi:CheY-like chemotaxis protein
LVARFATNGGQGKTVGTTGGAEEAAERTGDPIKISAIDGVKILLVDDDFRNIFALSALLERGHADVVIAESGAEALAALERTPDIQMVLMDIMMPVMDGYETIRAIRAIDEFKALPIIAVTGKVMGGERKRCIDAGANGYVPKPVDTAELLAALRPWLPTSAPSGT